MTFALIGPLGIPEILIILLVLVVIFGARRLPELGKGLGEGIKNFRGAMKDMKSDKDDEQAAEGSNKA